MSIRRRIHETSIEWSTPADQESGWGAFIGGFAVFTLMLLVAFVYLVALTPR
jgi:NADH:ubiquinone oxidoreductase subunit 3 (subunit A)